MRAHVYSFITILMVTLVVCQAARADVIISEIMYNPDQDDLNKEWVEIFNSGVATVDLSGWVFEDIVNLTAASPIPSGTLLGPGEALVVVEDVATFESRWGQGINRIELSNFPDLDNYPSALYSTGILALKDSFGTIQDIVDYDDENDWPTDWAQGPSIYVSPEFLSAPGNDDGTHWGSSTPGVDGAIYSQEPARRGDRASPGFVATEPTVFPPFTPSADAAWSMVVFPDTQNYVKVQAHLPQFVDMAEWVRDNRDEFNIQVVLHEGDIVNQQDNESPCCNEISATLQWQNAQAAMGILNGEVPYVMTVGNHDINLDDGTTRLNEFFAAADNPLVDPLQGGILKGVMEPGHLENAYYELTAPDGRELLILSLESEPLPEQLTWANQVAGQPQFANHTAILVTHDYLIQNDTRSGFGEARWNGFVKGNENFEMVFNGHYIGDGTGYLVSTGDNGNQVHQMVFNTQKEGNGGNGWLRVLEFLEDGRTVRARTYSPTFGYIREDIENAFTFELSQNSTPEPSTLTLAALALLSLFALGRRRRRE